MHAGQNISGGGTEAKRYVVYTMHWEQRAMVLDLTLVIR